MITTPGSTELELLITHGGGPQSKETLDYPEMKDNEYPFKHKEVECAYCGLPGLVWGKDLKDKWRLYQGIHLHSCKGGRKT